jgi:transposase
MVPSTHVMKLVNEAVDQVRRAEQKDEPELKRTRYLWLKNRENLNASHRFWLEDLLLEHASLQTVKAYQMKVSFQNFWTLPPEAAARFLSAWCRWVEDSGLAPMVRLARTIKTHRTGILRWFRTRISNGLLEGMSSLVQATKARARGYRSTRNLIAMIYLMNGKLRLSPPI